ncbi:MAG: alpha-amylase family glycosyl hydrolase [bacterium]
MPKIRIHYNNEYAYSQPELYVWADKMKPIKQKPDGNDSFGPYFDFDLIGFHDNLHFKFKDGEVYEPNSDNRLLKIDSPNNIWTFAGSNGVFYEDQIKLDITTLKIHLRTANKYVNSKLYIWSLAGNKIGDIEKSGNDDFGPYWEVPLKTDKERTSICFKFHKDDLWEPDRANKLWLCVYGNEVWTKSETNLVISKKPEMLNIKVKFKTKKLSPIMHIWQQDDFIKDIPSRSKDKFGFIYTVSLYTGLPYNFMFYENGNWEMESCIKTFTPEKDNSYIWAFDGVTQLFNQKPLKNKILTVSMQREPKSLLDDSTRMHIWAGNAIKEDIAPRYVSTNGRLVYKLKVYSGLPYRMMFHKGDNWERSSERSVVLEKSKAVWVIENNLSILNSPPPYNLFQNPDFWIKRPGVYKENGFYRFVLHAPHAGRVRVIGEFTDWEKNAYDLRLTEDKRYWWVSIPANKIRHGQKYKYLLNDDWYSQDPAASWVENSSYSACSQILVSDNYKWNDSQWRTPGFEYLIIYQCHIRRFTNRNGNQRTYSQLIEEIKENAKNNYLKDLGITVIELLPIQEFPMDKSWGYNPSFFYAPESAYGKPDELKEFVDICHQNGIAVILDVVFNHVGGDCALWNLAQETYFDGDTKWGAMINYDNEITQQFFTQNVLYLREEYHIDGFRFDCTDAIIHSTAKNDLIKKPGSDGGGNFLHKIRKAVKGVDNNIILIAEQLPNDFSLTNYGGPMDTQWFDDFHDILKKSLCGVHNMDDLAQAFTLGYKRCNEWNDVVNYSESHDEVGNTDDRIARVGADFKGYNMCKIAATATLMARGIPMLFMGQESGESKQFKVDNDDVLDLDDYEKDINKTKIREWTKAMIALRKNNPFIQNGADLTIKYTYNQDKIIAFTRGGDKYFVVMNFGGWHGYRYLGEMNLPYGDYKEIYNSTWPYYAFDFEDEHTNGGYNACLNANHSLNIPDYGVVILEKR